MSEGEHGGVEDEPDRTGKSGAVRGGFVHGRGTGSAIAGGRCWRGKVGGVRTGEERCGDTVAAVRMGKVKRRGGPTITGEAEGEDDVVIVENAGSEVVRERGRRFGVKALEDAGNARWGVETAAMEGGGDTNPKRDHRTNDAGPDVRGGASRDSGGWERGGSRGEGRGGESGELRGFR